ncbi:hypothetical protein [Enterococcus sp. AZ109]|uniref:hypothetical protein n=1 Tax=Enterococcus sp. AZ109 TaxID=2774634 RepID=UPI003F28328F
MQKANGFNEFYSIYTKGGRIEYFVDKQGNPTINYPHVHIIHRGNGQVEVVASLSRGKHPYRTTLNNPSGGDVNAAIRSAASYL